MNNARTYAQRFPVRSPRQRRSQRRTRRLSMRVCLMLCFAASCDFPRPADVPAVVIDADLDAAPDTGISLDAAPDTGISLDAAPDIGIPVSCTPNEFIACEANSARLCNATGDSTVTQDCGAAGCNADARRCNQCVPNAASCSTTGNALDHCGSDGLPGGQEACALGCVAGTAAHCAYLEPRYLRDVCDAVATLPDFTVTSLVTFDTGIDTSCTGGVVHQDAGRDICVVRYGSIRVTPSGTLGVLGSRALALVADSVLRIEGTLDISANGSRSGPGGSTEASGD